MVQTVVLQVLLKLTELHNVELRQFKKHLEDDRLTQKKATERSHRLCAARLRFSWADQPGKQESLRIKGTAFFRKRLMCDTNCPRCKNVLRSPEEIVKERERETAAGGLASCFKGGGRVGGRGVVWRHFSQCVAFLTRILWQLDARNSNQLRTE